VVDSSGAKPGAGIVAVAGEVLVDLVPADPDGHYEAVPGGSPANVAVGLARLGVPTRMLARLADDPLGRRLRAHLGENSVELGHTILAGEPTSLAVVELGADGVAEYDFRVDGTADWQWTDAELDTALASDSDGTVVALHSGSLALTTPPGDAALLRLMARGRDTATVSYDPNCRPLLMGAPADMLARVHEVLGLADVVKISTADLEWLLPGSEPQDVITAWLSRGPGLVVVTLGGDGVLAGTAAGLRRRPARQVTVVDTVGAGDAFSGGLLAGLHRRALLGAVARPSLAALAGVELDALLDEAVAVAALACTRRGADPPTYDEWQAFAAQVPS
jgi:fructokinase